MWLSVIARQPPAVHPARASLADISSTTTGIYFFAYNRAKERYQRRAGSTGAKLSPALHLASAAEAGAIVCFVTNPIWVVKTRLQLQRRTLQQAAAVAGVAGGAAAAAAGTAGGAAVAAGAAGVAGAAAGQAASAVTRGAASIPRLLGGGAGVAEACAVEYRGFLHCFVQIARCEGLRGLYKGLLPSLLLVSERVRGLLGAAWLLGWLLPLPSLAAAEGGEAGGWHSSLQRWRSIVCWLAATPHCQLDHRHSSAPGLPRRHPVCCLRGAQARGPGHPPRALHAPPALPRRTCSDGTG